MAGNLGIGLRNIAPAKPAELKTNYSVSIDSKSLSSSAKFALLKGFFVKNPAITATNKVPATTPATTD